MHSPDENPHRALRPAAPIPTFAHAASLTRPPIPPCDRPTVCAHRCAHATTQRPARHRARLLRRDMLDMHGAATHMAARDLSQVAMALVKMGEADRHWAGLARKHATKLLAEVAARAHVLRVDYLTWALWSGSKVIDARQPEGARAIELMMRALGAKLEAAAEQLTAAVAAAGLQPRDQAAVELGGVNGVEQLVRGPQDEDARLKPGIARRWRPPLHPGEMAGIASSITAVGYYCPRVLDALAKYTAAAIADTLASWQQQQEQQQPSKQQQPKQIDLRHDDDSWQAGEGGDAGGDGGFWDGGSSSSNGVGVGGGGGGSKAANHKHQLGIGYLSAVAYAFAKMDHEAPLLMDAMARLLSSMVGFEGREHGGDEYDSTSSSSSSTTSRSSSISTSILSPRSSNESGGSSPKSSRSLPPRPSLKGRPMSKSNLRALMLLAWSFAVLQPERLDVPSLVMRVLEGFDVDEVLGGSYRRAATKMDERALRQLMQVGGREGGDDSGSDSKREREGEGERGGGGWAEDRDGGRAGGNYRHTFGPSTPSQA